MNIDHMSYHHVSKNNSNTERLAYSQSIGSRMSAMEHLVPEQMFSTDTQKAQGISAVKALAIASQQGQKIWTITESNLELALSKINLGVDIENDIRNSVYAGKIVTAHEAQINFNGWIGEGYISFDPVTGSGAYQIASGGNGSFMKFINLVNEHAVALSLLSMFLGLFTGSIVLIGPIALVGLFISLVVVFAQITRYIADEKNEPGSACETGIKLVVYLAVAFAALALKGLVSALGAETANFLAGGGVDAWLCGKPKQVE